VKLFEWEELFMDDSGIIEFVGWLGILKPGGIGLYLGFSICVGILGCVYICCLMTFSRIWFPEVDWFLKILGWGVCIIEKDYWEGLIFRLSSKTHIKISNLAQRANRSTVKFIEVYFNYFGID
jgi:hypothetical protein